MASTLLEMASNLLAMVSNLRAIASDHGAARTRQGPRRLPNYHPATLDLICVRGPVSKHPDSGCSNTNEERRPQSDKVKKW